VCWRAWTKSAEAAIAVRGATTCDSARARVEVAERAVAIVGDRREIAEAARPATVSAATTRNGPRSVTHGE
jgi:hypothetical protein